MYSDDFLDEVEQINYSFSFEKRRLSKFSDQNSLTIL